MCFLGGGKCLGNKCPVTCLDVRRRSVVVDLQCRDVETRREVIHGSLHHRDSWTGSRTPGGKTDRQTDTSDYRQRHQTPPPSPLVGRGFYSGFSTGHRETRARPSRGIRSRRSTCCAERARDENNKSSIHQTTIDSSAPVKGCRNILERSEAISSATREASGLLTRGSQL